MDEQLIGIKEMANLLGVPHWNLYQRTRRGTIPCYRVGRYVRFDPVEVKAFFRVKEVDGNAHRDDVS